MKWINVCEYAQRASLQQLQKETDKLGSDLKNCKTFWAAIFLILGAEIISGLMRVASCLGLVQNDLARGRGLHLASVR